MLVPVLASAYELPYKVTREYIYYTNIDGIYYKLNDNSRTASVMYRLYEKEYHDGKLWSTQVYSANYSGDIVIPSIVKYNDIS